VFLYPLFPPSTQIYLMEFLQHIQDPVPSKVRLFLDYEGENPLPDYLVSEDVTIDRLYMETSVVASNLSEDEIHTSMDRDYDAINALDISIK